MEREVILDWNEYKKYVRENGISNSTSLGEKKKVEIDYKE